MELLCLLEQLSQRAPRVDPRLPFQLRVSRRGEMGRPE